MELNIRLVKPEDINAFVKTYINAYSTLPDYKYTSKKDIKNYFKWLYKRDPEGFFVAEVNGKPVGFCACDSHWVNKNHKLVLAIHEIFVLPDFSGKGIGKALIQKALEYGRSKGLNIVELWVGEKNYKAINFYKNLGFKEEGKWGKWIKMTKCLSY